MRGLVYRLFALEMMSKQVHYEYVGKDFMSIHKLMDKVYDLSVESRDSVLEDYFMGIEGEVPSAIEIIDEGSEFITVEVALGSILGLITDILDYINDLPKFSDKSTENLIGGIAQDFVKYKFFLSSVLG